MMPLVEIEPDVYDFVRNNIRDFGETPSRVLRRLLNLPEPKASSGASAEVPKPPVPTPPAPAPVSTTPMLQFVTDMRTGRYRTATAKFLAILAFAHKQDPGAFANVLRIDGRSRKYFGRSKEEITNSGTSTHPKQIPGTPYWVMTNADTSQKRDMLKQALRVMGYSADDIRAADSVVS